MPYQVPDTSALKQRGKDAFKKKEEGRCPGVSNYVGALLRALCECFT